MAFEADVKYQYWAAVCVNLISLSCGNFVVWPSSSFLVLQSKESPLETGPLSDETAGWIIAMFALGGFFGTLISTLTVERAGMKRPLQLSALTMFAAWVILPFALHPIYLMIARFLGGVTSGILFSVIPLYISDLADDSVRGFLGTFVTFAFNIGLEMTFILSYYFHYDTVAWINLPLPVVFLVLISFLPEPPRQLMLKNKTEKAEKAFRYFRNIRGMSVELTDTQKFELEKLKTEQNKAESEETALTLKDFREPTALKASLISLGILAMSVLCGCFALLNYTGTIFKESGSNLSPHRASIVVGAITILGSYAASTFVDRSGRKILLVISSFGSMMGLATLGIYVYLSKLGWNVNLFNWVPLASFSFTIFIATMGLMTIPFLVMPELLPPKIRDFVIMGSMLILWLMNFAVLRITSTMNSYLGMHGTMFVFSGFCLIGTIFIMKFLPETKGRSNEEILSLL